MAVRSHDHVEAQVRDQSAKTFRVRVPASDIDACVRVPLWRRVLTLGSILLVLTDIPRTGLSFRIKDFYHTVAPGTVMYWGPYEYPVARLNTTDDGVVGFDGDEYVEDFGVWPYKHDTLSIAPRAIAKHLGVSSYPACIQYREPCNATGLPSAIVFSMLDGLVTAIRDSLFDRGTVWPDQQPYVFATKSNWVDRLHHHVFRSLTKNPNHRLHSLYHLADPRRMCDLSPSDALPRRSRPAICDHPVGWLCEHPLTPSGRRDTPVWEHIALRFSHLSQQYPSLELDFTMFISRLLEQSHSDTNVPPTVRYLSDAIEVTTLIRGKQCDSTHRHCRTVFIDDYRYERAQLENDESEWPYYASILRFISQCYFCFRICFLIVGCYAARNREPGSLTRKLILALRTAIKIPAPVVVYGSWLPLVGYSLAHLFDSMLVHSVGEFTWSSVGGFYAFNPSDYVVAASLQMRNIWMIALVCRGVLGLYNGMVRRRSTQTNMGRDGMLAFRGGWIGFVSWLTTFGLMRALCFRDTDIVGFVELTQSTPVNQRRELNQFRNYCNYGIRFDAKCCFMAAAFTLLLGLISQAIVKTFTGRPTSLLICRTHYLPFSAGTLWPWSSLGTFWFFDLRAHSSALNSIVPAPPRSAAQRRSTHTGACFICAARASVVHWRSIHGCIRHEPIFDVHRRTVELWSMVRLANIAQMTDPLVLFRLYVVGRPLYLYRVQSFDESPYLLLLPIVVVEDKLPSKHRLPRMPRTKSNWTTELSVTWELVSIVDSRDVPWHVLVNCG